MLVGLEVGADPGGSSDLISRAVSKGLSDELGASFPVINKPGANGALAAAELASAEPDGSTIANQNACMGCHAVDRKLVGPAYQDVAAKYKGDAGAQAKLIKKVREGGMGNWGQIPMPANPKIADADLKTVIDWVLAGAPAK